MAVDYRFYNANPLSNIESDCVCRAISRATRLDYYDVAEKLNLIANLFECEALCVCCYSHLLEKVFGFKQRFANGMTVAELADMYRNDILLIRINGHLTMSEYGNIYDIWDCRDEIADVYWIVK